MNLEFDVIALEELLDYIDELERRKYFYVRKEAQKISLDTVIDNLIRKAKEIRGY